MYILQYARKPKQINLMNMSSRYIRDWKSPPLIRLFRLRSAIYMSEWLDAVESSSCLCSINWIIHWLDNARLANDLQMHYGLINPIWTGLFNFEFINLFNTIHFDLFWVRIWIPFEIILLYQHNFFLLSPTNKYPTNVIALSLPILQFSNNTNRHLI